MAHRTLTPQRRKLLIVLALALVAEGLLLTPLPPLIRTLALLLWAAYLPGHLLVEIMGSHFGAPPTRLEWGVYAVGAGYSLLLSVMLLLSYLPGPLAAWQLHLVVNSMLLLLVLLAWPIAAREAVSPLPLPRWEVLMLGAILTLAAALRLLNLGYAEFHGDEARAVLRAAAVIQGYADVLFLHKKGPAEILLPAAIFAGVGQITEAAARLPFALAGLTAVGAVYWLGRRLLGPVAGIAAALLLAVDGFAIGFSRLVQYQSIVILMSALTLLALVRLWQSPRQLARGLLLAALLLATGLWAHYEAGLAAVPALFLIAALWRHEATHRGELVRGMAMAVALGAALLALFYLPFLRHEQFGATYTYLVERRIAGDGFPVNNIADFFIRTTTYSSSYYALFMLGVTLLALVNVYRRTLGAAVGLAASVALLALVTLTAWQPAWATVEIWGAGERDWLVVAFVLALLPAWFSPRLRVEERLIWLWWGLLALIMLFFTSKPRTHVYVFFVPWTLLVGMAFQATGNWLARHTTPRRVAWAGGVTAILLATIFGGYVYQMFAYTRTELLRTWDVNWPRGYWRPYAVLDNRALFGFPLANGWKVVGQLYADGTLTGDYATNEVEFWTPIWYTQGRMRCEEGADWFFQISNPQPDPAGYRAAIEERLAKDYAPWGTVTINGDPRMTIRQRSQVSLPPQTLALADYAATFDAAATPDLPLGYPVVEPPITYPLHVNMNGQIWLEGYDLAAPSPLRAGDTITLTLYWRAQQEISESYKVFNQSYYGDGIMVAQQDGYPVCGSRGTWLWDAGELIADVHTITVRAGAPDGLYPLYTGMYIEETGERLSVMDAAGNPVADQVHLTDIRVGVE